MDQLRSHLETNKLSEILQSAFRAQHSKETALLKVMNDILTDCDSGNVSLLNLLDLSAAFDTIDHGILLQRLEIIFGVSGTALEWFKSYFSNRHQAVVIRGKSHLTIYLSMAFLRVLSYVMSFLPYTHNLWCKKL